MAASKNSTGSRMARAQEAEALASHKTLKEAFEFMVESATLQWKNARTPEEAWEASRRLQAAQEFAQTLVVFIRDGKNAARELEVERKRLAERDQWRTDREGEQEYARRAQEAREQAAKEAARSGKNT